MRIDATRYTKFWANPERYRLAQLWNLAPKLPAPGSWSRLMLRGRLRGSAFHEIMDGGHTAPGPIYTAEELAAAEEMANLVRKTYPDEKTLHVEVEFEYPIPNSSHVAVGRIDHIIERPEYKGPVVGDYKTCGRCTKKELGVRVESYLNSAQVPFYLLGARALGYDMHNFLFRIVQKDKIHEFWKCYGNLELRKFERSIRQTCAIIEFLTEEFGIEDPWPTLHEKFSTGFLPQLGHKMFPGYMPDGFEARKEHLAIIEEHEDEGD